VDVPIVGDCKRVLAQLNAELRKVKRDWPKDLEEWHGQIAEWQQKHPLKYYQHPVGAIKPQYAIEEIYRVTEEHDPIVTTGVGQHQMWAAQYYRSHNPRRWITSGGLGTMGFGFPAALGAQAAFPDKLVIDIDGDGGFLSPDRFPELRRRAEAGTVRFADAAGYGTALGVIRAAYEEGKKIRIVAEKAPGTITSSFRTL
jgi:thiamine pyrophosphate-dependent acetolactate synthase large subunit-like protein